jgi:copper resistance protein C
MRSVWSQRVAVALVVALATAFCSTGPAAAHASQTGSTPAAGAVLTSAPAVVEVEFDADLMDVGAALVVRDSRGTSITTGPPEIQRNRISVPVSPDAAAGEYVVAYRVVSADGHTVSTSFTYAVVADAPPSAAASTATGPPTGQPSAAASLAAPSATAPSATAPSTAASLAVPSEQGATAGSGRLLLFLAVMVVGAAVIVGLAVLLGRRERYTGPPGR